MGEVFISATGAPSGGVRVGSNDARGDPSPSPMSTTEKRLIKKSSRPKKPGISGKRYFLALKLAFDLAQSPDPGEACSFEVPLPVRSSNIAAVRVFVDWIGAGTTGVILGPEFYHPNSQGKTGRIFVGPAR